MGLLDARAVLLGLVTAKLRIEFSYHKLVGKMGACRGEGALSTVDGEGGLELSCA